MDRKQTEKMKVMKKENDGLKTLAVLAIVTVLAESWFIGIQDQANRKQREVITRQQRMIASKDSVITRQMIELTTNVDSFGND